MIDGRERRPFAASRHVGRTKVRDDVDLERRRGTLAVAELPRKACARSMQDGLAVQADESDAPAGNRKSGTGMTQKLLAAEEKTVSFGQCRFRPRRWPTMKRGWLID